MDGGSVTTPFGRRSMTLGMLANQHKATNIEPQQSVDKWKLFRAICEAKPMLGISDRALAVLNALLSFYPAGELSRSNGLIVFPSNAQLSIRAHGIAPATLRRHLAALVNAGLLIRKDSPNGKRYARRNHEGEINQAFGFSLAPLLARCSEIQSYAAQVLAARQMMRTMKERLSLCRRDIAKLIDAAINEHVAGDWNEVQERFREITLRIPRAPSLSEMEALMMDMEMLRTRILNVLETCIYSENIDANESQFERHIQESDPDSHSVFEPANENQQAIELNAKIEIKGSDQTQPQLSTYASQPPLALKSFPLAFVLQTCPDIAMYAPGGGISSWREMTIAATVVRTMLGISDSAYDDACRIMGMENTATVIACVLERAGSINSAGGYLRDLTRRAERGEFAVGPMLISLAKTKASGWPKAGTRGKIGGSVSVTAHRGVHKSAL